MSMHIKAAFVSEDSTCCDFSADAGQVCALLYCPPDSTWIGRYALCGHDVQADAQRSLEAEWGSVDVCRWASASDVLYIMTVEGKFAGCVAVDRRLFVPYISHLLVTRDLRRRGYGRVLLEFATMHVANQGFDEARLWCDALMTRFYTMLGWEVDVSVRPASSDTVVMYRTGIQTFAFTHHTYM